MKWIFAGLVVTTAACASNLAQLEIATAEDMKRFDVISNAIDAGSYRDKTLTCASPEWADQAFIEECIEWAKKGVIGLREIQMTANTIRMRTSTEMIEQIK